MVTLFKYIELMELVAVEPAHEVAELVTGNFLVIIDVDFWVFANVECGLNTFGISGAC